MLDSKEKIAAFDFDGTITTCDTLFDFIRFYHGDFWFITRLIFLLPMLIGYKIGLIENGKAKERLFSHFFKGTQLIAFDSVCRHYAMRINKICNAQTKEKMQTHLSHNDRVVIVSASIENWIKPWSLLAQVNEVIGTQIEVKEGVITGKFSSKNCYGVEKVNRFLLNYPNRSDYTLYAYGDSEGDKELLALSDYPTLVKH